MKKKSTFAAKRKYRPKKLPIIIAALIIMTVTAVISFATAGDTFTIKVDGAQTSNYHEFTYKVLSEPNAEKNGTVQVSEYVYHTLYIDNDGDKLTIPATVTYEDKTYDVTEIGEDAFKNHA